MTGQYVNISRTIWTIAMNGLASPDPEVRISAYTHLLAAAPPGWEAGIDHPEGMRPVIPPREDRET